MNEEENWIIGEWENGDKSWAKKFVIEIICNFCLLEMKELRVHVYIWVDLWVYYHGING